MTWWITACLLIASVISIQAREITRPRSGPRAVSPYGRLLLMRDRRNPVGVYTPPRAMMLTGFYRPVRHSTGSQATGVFAQGNAVSGGAYLAGTHNPNYQRRDLEPLDQTRVSSAEAEAALEPQGAPVYGNEEDVSYPLSQDEPELQENDQPDTQLNNNESERSPEVPLQEEEEEEEEAQKPGKTLVKKPQGTKTKKTSVHVESDDDDDSDEIEEDDEEDSKPFVPFKSNKRGDMPNNLNNFFPMIFSFPKSGARGGSSPGTITAIANSFSTGKSGIASSVATAYGGSPNGKKKRNQPSQK
ncbi:NSFL1 cofactor p47 homolog isoform X3 [Microplitis mediator]|uniref:NSFL1 cofactor p47 homolog isoform X3 n=1 Tax=Microplitis mediator TaxID=375433 RepID=UPI002553F6CE|nr:NSFL1 cofactor p47 homolog isoform X3 [Microplitis mediator]